MRRPLEEMEESSNNSDDRTFLGPKAYPPVVIYHETVEGTTLIVSQRSDLCCRPSESSAATCHYALKKGSPKCSVMGQKIYRCRSPSCKGPNWIHLKCYLRMLKKNRNIMPLWMRWDEEKEEHLIVCSKRCYNKVSKMLQAEDAFDFRKTWLMEEDSYESESESGGEHYACEKAEDACEVIEGMLEKGTQPSDGEYLKIS